MNKIKRVIVFTNTLKNGGAEKQSILLAKSLADEFETFLIVYYGNQYDIRLKEMATNAGINTFWLKGSHAQKFFWLYKYFKKEKNTFIFSYLATTNFINGFVGRVSKVKYKIGGIRSSRLSPAKLLVQRFIHNYLLNKTICNNLDGFNYLSSRGFAPDKFKVLHNGIEISPFEKRITPQKDSVTILSVGRFVAQKDYPTALLAVYELIKKLLVSASSLKIKYVIVGYGELEQEVRDLVRQYNMEEVVEIVINPPSVRYYFESADIYLSTSLFEGLSNSIMEALEFYLPVVATDVGDNNQLVQGGLNGFLVQVKDIQGLANALEKVVKDVDLRIEMGKASRKHLEDKFSLDAFKEKYMQFICNLP